MKIETKYNIDDEVKFYPFGKSNLGFTYGKICAISVKACENSLNIEYKVVANKDFVVWCVSEETCYLFKKMSV